MFILTYILIHKIRRSMFKEQQFLKWDPMILFRLSQLSLQSKEIKIIGLLEIRILAHITMSDITLLQFSMSLLRGKVVSPEEILSQLSQPLHLTTHSDISRRTTKWSPKWFFASKLKKTENTKGMCRNSRGVNYYHFLQWRSTFQTSSPKSIWVAV
jgi:hypothetical protein